MMFVATPGLKFGCDYLLHPLDEHDKYNMHSKYCAYFGSLEHISSGKEIRGLSGSDIVGMCRAAKGVRKKVLITLSNPAPEAEEFDSPQVISLEGHQCCVLEWVTNPFSQC